MTDIEKLEKRVARLEEFILEVIGDIQGKCFGNYQERVIEAWGEFEKETSNE